MADVKAALEKQGMADFQFMEGDAVLFRTGWGKYWKTDNDKFNSGEPGIGMEVARWLSDEVKAGLCGSDHLGERGRAQPGPRLRVLRAPAPADPPRHRQSGEHEPRGARRGRRVTFMYVYSPVPIAGATGSAGSPVAIN